MALVRKHSQVYSTAIFFFNSFAVAFIVHFSLLVPNNNYVTGLKSSLKSLEFDQPPLCHHVWVSRSEEGKRRSSSVQSPKERVNEREPSAWQNFLVYC